MLIYSAIASLDGYVEDASGGFAWAEPAEDVFRFLNDQERSVHTYLYGRRMFETMAAWEATPVDESVPDFIRDFTELWRSADKVVYSRSLQSVSTSKTRIEREVDPQAVQRLKEEASGDLTVGGPDLAGQMLAAGLVDELHLYATPVIVGGGKPWLPSRVNVRLELLDARSFASGFVFVRYRVN
jgi:dihydrofolate reductase